MMYKISNNIVMSILVFSITTIFSHSIMAGNKQCDEVMDTLYGYKWFYKVFGVITQLNDCALIDGLKIEMGSYFAAKRDEIASDIKQGGGEGLNKLGLYMGCNDENLSKFSKMVNANQNYILGDNFENQARTVMLRIRQKINEDDKLKDSCKD